MWKVDVAWPTFVDLAVTASVRSALVPDADLAATALEHGATVCTHNRDFTRCSVCVSFPLNDQGCEGYLRGYRCKLASEPRLYQVAEKLISGKRGRHVPGAPYVFKVRGSDRIGGFGFFSFRTEMPLAIAWDTFLLLTASHHSAKRVPRLTSYVQQPRRMIGSAASSCRIR